MLNHDMLLGLSYTERRYLLLFYRHSSLKQIPVYFFSIFSFNSAFQMPLKSLCAQFVTVAVARLLMCWNQTHGVCIMSHGGSFKHREPVAVSSSLPGSGPSSEASHIMERQLQGLVSSANWGRAPSPWARLGPDIATHGACWPPDIWLQLDH